MSSPSVLDRDLTPQRKKLLHSSETVHRVAEDYLKSDPFAIEDRAELLSTCHSSLDSISGSGLSSYDTVKDVYKEAIENLYAARDAKQGVRRFIKGDVLVRDARDVSKIDRHSSEAIAANFVNLSRASEVMLDDALKSGASPEEVEKVRRQTRKMAAEIVAAVEGGEAVTGKTLIHLTDKMVKSLKNLKNKEGKGIFENPKKTLDKAKALTNLDDDHKHIVTISKIKDKEGKERAVVESDIMLQGTIPELKAQYQAIIDGKEQPEWFTKLKKEQQALVKRYAPALRDGEKVVSSQLFDFIPGLKNAFLKKVQVGKKTDGKLELETISEVLHAGTPAFAGKGDKEEGTSLAVKQARQFAPKGDEFTLHVLNSSANEGKIVDPLKRYAKRESRDAEVDFAPVNPVRRISHTRHDATERTLRTITEKAKKNLTENSVIRRYLENGETRPWYKPWQKTDKAKAFAAISTIESDGKTSLGDIKTRDLSAAIRLKAAKDRGVGFFRHNNFKISADALVAEFSGAVKRTRLLFCKSGKDRTGSVLFKTAFLSTSDHLGLTAAAKSGDKSARDAMEANLQSQVHSGHTQFMAGGPGGTIGAFGVKPQTTASSLDKSLRSVSDHLGLETADRNKVKKRGKMFKWFGPKTGSDKVAKKIIEGMVTATSSSISHMTTNPMRVGKSSGTSKGRGR